MLEIEVKARVSDLAALRKRLLELGADLVRERHAEVNVLYDFRSRDLLANRQALRLRTSGKKAYLTFKGAPRKSRRFKVREEFETEVKRPEYLRKILKGLGLIPVFRYEKRRTVFRKGTLKICLDETGAGNFAEFEGEREKIVRFSKVLGVPRTDWIKQDYVQLLIEAGKGESLIGRPV